MIRFLVDKPIVYLSEISSLVITDLHIGIEHELYQSGIVIPSQADTFASILKESAELTGAKKLIILGDVKHEIPSANLREFKEIPKFFSKIKNYFEEIHITKGNHDGNIESILPEFVKVHDGHGFKLKKFGFFHGHAWPKKEVFECDWIFTGHLQPAVELKDLFGYKLIERVWLRGRIDKPKLKKLFDVGKTGKMNLIVLPSFNKLAGFFVLNKERERNFDSVITKIVTLSDFDVYLLDGTHLGKLAFLQPNS